MENLRPVRKTAGFPRFPPSFPQPRLSGSQQPFRPLFPQVFPHFHISSPLLLRLSTAFPHPVENSVETVENRRERPRKEENRMASTVLLSACRRPYKGWYLADHALIRRLRATFPLEKGKAILRATNTEKLYIHFWLFSFGNHTTMESLKNQRTISGTAPRKRSLPSLWVGKVARQRRMRGLGNLKLALAWVPKSRLLAPLRGRLNDAVICTEMTWKDIPEVS